MMKTDNSGWVRQEFPVAFYPFFLNLQFSSSVQRPYCAQLGGFKAPSPQNWGRKAGFFKALGSQTSQISLGKHLETKLFSQPKPSCAEAYLSGRRSSLGAGERLLLFQGGHFGYGIGLGVASPSAIVGQLQDLLTSRYVNPIWFRLVCAILHTEHCTFLSCFRLEGIWAFFSV